jgi:hypothetical protein
MLDGQHDDCAAKQEGAVTFNKPRSPVWKKGEKDIAPVIKHSNQAA